MTTPVMQDASALLNTLLQGQGVSAGQLGGGQLADLKGNNAQGDFLATLQESLDDMLQVDVGAAEVVNPTSQILQDIQKLLNSQLPVTGNTLPTAEGQALPLVTPEGEMLGGIDPQELAKRLQALLDSGDAAEPAIKFPVEQGNAGVMGGVGTLLNPGMATTTNLSESNAQPVLAAGLVQGGGAQLLADRRRVAERFSAITDARPAINREIPEASINLDKTLMGQAQAQQSQGNQQDQELAGPDWMRQIYSSQPKPGQEYSTEGAQLRDQAVLINESRHALSALKVAVAVDNAAANDAPDANINLAGLSQQVGRPALSATTDVRPMPMQSYIPSQLHDPQWQSDFSQRISMLARNGNQTAEIRLNPANLGPIEVRVVMNDDQASISFSSQSGAVREAIEASLPRLREMFSSSGLQLADTQVSDQSLQEHHQQQRREQGGSAPGYEDRSGDHAAANERDGVGGMIDLSHIQSASDLQGVDLFA
ncbi:flagellar hook-length control protein FliK [Pseudomonadota bacterium]